MSVDGKEPDSSAQSDLSSDGAVSRQTNENKSVKSSNDGSGPFEDCPLRTKAKVEKCVSEFTEKYPQKSRMPIATGDRRKLRREYADIETEEWKEDLRLPEDEYKSYQLPDSRPSGECDGEITAPTWADALKQLLHKYANTKETTLELRLGERPLVSSGKEGHSPPDPRPVYEVDAKSRWQPEYQKKYRAQLEGWLRELTGGERPTGGRTDASFEKPHIALISLSGSSTPNGGRIGPVDLNEELNTTWSDHTYHAVRNTLRSLGFDSNDWSYDRRSEPHTNKRGNREGTNACYSHEHIILVIDGEVTETDLRPIVEKHVEKCDFAGESAHGESAIEVREPDELDDIGQYVSDYASVAPVDLFDREPEFQAFAASAAAANYRTVTRSEAAREAARVDMCRQRFESDKSKQHRDHGEEVRYDDGDIVCIECQCTHDINQHQTLADYRKSDNENLTPAIADGGCKIQQKQTETEKTDLREQWKDANAAARIGCETVERTCNHEMYADECPLCRSDDEPPFAVPADTPIPEDATTVRSVEPELESFGSENEPEWKKPEWQVNKVRIRDKEYPASSGNGMSYVETATTARFDTILDEDKRYKCNCKYRGSGDEMANHLYSAHGIDTVDIARQCVEKSDELEYGDDTGIIPPDHCVPPRLLREEKPWRRERQCPKCHQTLVHTASDPIAECACNENREPPPSETLLPKEKVVNGEYPPPEIIAEQLLEVSGLRTLALVECDECGWRQKVETHVDSVACPECHGDVPFPTPKVGQITVPDVPETTEETKAGQFELNGGRLTPKEWNDNWYENRHGDDNDGDESLVEKVRTSISKPLTVNQKDIVERIRMVESAHPDKGTIELATKYDAIEHMEIVEATLNCVRE